MVVVVPPVTKTLAWSPSGVDGDVYWSAKRAASDKFLGFWPIIQL